jgi:putative ABC transport system permease protein
VLLQFLIEAVTLAAMGGIVGIVIATVASFALAGVMGVPFLFDPGINLLSFIFSAGSASCSAIFRHGARLSSIRSRPLRHE